MQAARVLIVEDEKIISLDLTRTLKNLGFEVVSVVSNGPDALESATENRPDIILMDIMLAGEMDGIEAARRIKTDLDIPVVFITAYADEATLERAKEAEPFGYIIKPFKERELYSTINIALYKSKIDKQISRQERLFGAILDSMDEALIAADTQGRVQFLNPAAETLTGWPEVEAYAQPVDAVLELLDAHTEAPTSLPLNGTSLTTPRSTLRFEDLVLNNRHGGRLHITGTITPVQYASGEPETYLIAFKDITAVRRMSATLAYQASHDALTGLLNRRELIDQLAELVQTPSQDRPEHSFISVDIDQFKIINDVCGHVAGDELIRQCAQELRDYVHELPDADQHLVGRPGGDEFAVTLYRHRLQDALAHAEQVREFFNRRFIWHEHVFQVSASIAVVPILPEISDTYTVIAAADDARYLAKEEGGNRVKVYENKSATFVQRRGEMHWISRLNTAIEENQFVLHGQRILPAREGIPEKLEILIRLRDNEDKLHCPGDFIPAAEKYHLMPQVDRWVIRESFAYAAGRSPGEPSSRPLCINISAGSIADKTFVDFLLSELSRLEVDPRLITLEITETTAIENRSSAIGVIEALREAGVAFALDDFGNGFSSFAYLKDLPFDYLKIDGSFVKDVDTNPVHYALVDGVNRIGHTMGMLTIAEFVHSDSVRRTLIDIGVDYLQGYELAMPAPLYHDHEPATT